MKGELLTSLFQKTEQEKGHVVKTMEQLRYENIQRQRTGNS